MKLKILTISILLILICCNFIASANIQNNKVTNQEDYDYYSFDELTILLDQLHQDFQNIFSYESLGKTYEGRDIWLVKISDNVSIDEDEPEVLFTGGIHGNEKPSFEVVIYTLKSIAENYSSINVNESFSNRVRDIVNNTELYFIPMVNPDGVESGTRKNKIQNDCIFGDKLFRGVDLNRNFDWKWNDFNKHPFKYTLNTILKIGGRSTIMFPFLDIKSIVGEGTYRGPYPFSENETRAIKRFVENHSIKAGIDYHTYGRKIGYPWAWTKESPADEDVFISIAENISEINEYSFFQWSDWYFVNGFFTDWMYGEHEIFHFLIELDPTNVHGPRFQRDFKPVSEICETHLLVNLYLAERSLTLN
jgi:hypothetical protein